MDDRTPRPYASSDEGFVVVPDAANGTTDTLTLTAAAELSHVAPACARATVACNITAAASEGKRRPDIDVVVVMDRSGSMEAERKLELCKETTELLIEQLRPSDRFGLVSFDHHVKTPAKLAKTIDNLIGFRNYLHFHIKAAKTNLHMRMRRKVNSWIQIVNRAIMTADKPKDMKTSSGKTFTRK